MRDRADIVFDGEFEGLLCVVYEYYYGNILPLSISAIGFAQTSLFSDSMVIQTDMGKSRRVADALEQKIGQENALRIYRAFSCPDVLYMDIFQYIVYCFRTGAEAPNHLELDFVRNVEKAAIRTGREAHYFLGIARFTETKSGVLYCPIEPHNFILPQLGNHFTQRLHPNRFVIHDIGRGLASIYDGSRLTIVEAGKTALVDPSTEDAAYQELWRSYYKAIAVEDRISGKRRRGMLPLKYRGHLTEFLPGKDDERPPALPWS